VSALGDLPNRAPDALVPLPFGLLPTAVALPILAGGSPVSAAGVAPADIRVNASILGSLINDFDFTPGCYDQIALHVNTWGPA